MYSKLTKFILFKKGANIGNKIPTAAKLWAVSIPIIKERHEIVNIAGNSVK